MRQVLITIGILLMFTAVSSYHLAFVPIRLKDVTRFEALQSPLPRGFDSSKNEVFPDADQPSRQLAYIKFPPHPVDNDALCSPLARSPQAPIRLLLFP